MKVSELLVEKKPAGSPDWHDSSAPDANGKFKDLGINALADWLIKTRGKNLQKINGSLQQQIVFNRNKNPQYAAKMKSTLEVVKRKLNEDVSDSEQKRRDDLYARWKKLVNMSASQVESFKASQLKLAKQSDSKYPGLKPKEARSLGISSGVQSAQWIVKMKRTPRVEWTPEMWKWAGKQVSFISRMLGNEGPLMKDGQPTRKLLSLKIWGHNPK